MPVERRFVFDQVAELYDRARPRYPEALVEDVIALSRIPRGGRILEIGCGTGQATEPFARRGFRITCLEPGAALGAVARVRLASFADVAIEPCTFEAWPLEPEAFDLVISAQAFHWVAPEARFSKTAAALRPGGSLAVFGNTVLDERSPLHDALDAAYVRHAPALLHQADSRWYEQSDAFAQQVAESGRFEPVTHRVHPWAQTYSAEDYVDLMRTHSNHRLLPDAQREALHEALARAIDTHGGTMPVRYEAHLYVAMRF